VRVGPGAWRSGAAQRAQDRRKWEGGGLAWGWGSKNLGTPGEGKASVAAAVLAMEHNTRTAWVATWTGTQRTACLKTAPRR